jgi:4-diphosphocytidyl-2-C-methyl-D-erythritol kinase
MTAAPRVRETAPAKVNLVLQVGPRRADGLHEVCSLFASLDLADVVTVEEAPNGEDVVRCPPVEGPNLAEAAIAAIRSATERALPPLRVTIHKRIPVAAGLGGASADAAAVLRAANELLGGPYEPAELRRISAPLGADVPSQIEPGHALVTGAGEAVDPIALPEMALTLIVQAKGLGAAEVYAEADRLASTRRSLEPERLRRIARFPLAALAMELESDLEPAVLSLRPELARTIEAMRTHGALAAQVTGSGPTVFGVFADRSAAERAASLTSDALVTMVRAPGEEGTA